MRALICSWISGATFASMSVSVNPGAMALTVTLNFASSMAAVLVNAMMPPLLAA
jgi:hypothetical protein